MSEPKKIFIITRREFNLNQGVGFNTGDKEKIAVSMNQNFFNFWEVTLLNKEVLKSIIDEIKSKSEINNNDVHLDVLYKNEKFKNNYLEYFKLSEKRIPENIEDVYNCEYYGISKSVNVLPACFDKLLAYYHKFHEFEIEYVKNIVNPEDGIYVYHHWLDKQSVNYTKRIQFLPMLRKAVIDNIEKKESDIIEVNWLIHDTDLGASGGDGLLYFNKEKINDEFFARSKELQILITNELKEDNIWIFTHTKGIKGYYDTIVLKPEEYKNSEDLYKKMVHDSKKLNNYIQLFNKMGIVNKPDIDINDVFFKDFKDTYNRAINSKSIVGEEINNKTNVENFWKIVKSYGDK